MAKRSKKSNKKPKKGAKKKRARKAARPADPLPEEPSAAEQEERRAVRAIAAKAMAGEILKPREQSRLERYEKKENTRLILRAFYIGVNQKMVCELFTITRETLRKIWYPAGFPRNPDGLHPLIKCVPWAKEYYRSQAKEPEDTKRKEEESIAREKRIALEDARRIRHGKLVERKKVEEDCWNCGRSTRDALRAIPRVAAAKVRGKPVREVETYLAGVIDAALERLTGVTADG